MKSLLLFLSLVSVAASTGVVRSTSSKSDVAYFNYAGTSDKKSIGGGELLQKLLPGEPVSTYETQFLNENNFGLVYSSLPQNNDLVNFASFNDKLYAEAKSYSYKSGNITYTWLPSALKIGEKEYVLDFNENTKRYFVSAPYDGVSQASINYKISFDLDSSKVERLLNSAYEEGKYLSDTNDEYEANKAAYEQYLIDLANYQEQIIKYTEYMNVVDAYNAYQQELATYYDNLKKYNDYLNEVATFEDRVAAYNAYLNELEIYNNNKDVNQKEYDAYMATLEVADHQLAAMDILFKNFTVSDSVRNIYELVMGNTVDTVLANKDDLVSLLSVPEKIITEAYNATCSVRIYLNEYRMLQTKEAKYQYYFYRYYFIKQQTEHLLRCLDKLYRWGSVSDVVESKGKKTQYIQLIAGLAYFCDAIDDFPIYNYEGYNKATDNGSLDKPGARIIDKDWTFEGKKYSQWIVEPLIDITKKGEPVTGKYPTDPVELLVPPTPVEKPVYPSEVKKPVMPTNEPTDPSTMTPVSKPTIPVEVEEPVEPTFSVLDLNLISAYKNSSLKKRDLPSSLKVDFFESVEKTSSNTKNVAIFHDEYGAPIYYSFFDEGAVFEGEEPYKPGDESFISYETVWIDSEDNLIELETLDESIELFPSFVGTDLQQYTITFKDNFGNTLKTTKVLAGKVPVYVGTPFKEDVVVAGKNYYYEFTGWDRPFEMAFEDTTYIASFVQKPYLTVSYKADGQIYLIEEHKEGEQLVAPEEFPGSFNRGGVRFIFKSWDYDYSQPITSNLVINAKYEEDAYTVTFVIEGKNYVQWVDIGEVPEFLGKQPTKESTYTTSYSFAGWSKSLNGEVLEQLEPAYSTARYYAIFKETSIVFASDSSEADVVDSGTLMIDASGLENKTLNVESMMAKFRKNSAKPCLFTFNNIDISFSETQMESLASSKLMTVKLVLDIDEFFNYQLEINLFDESGQKINNDSIIPVINISHLQNADHYRVIRNDEVVNSEATSNQLTYRARVNTKYDVKVYYKVNINYFGKIDIGVDKQFALPNERVNVLYEIGEDLEITSKYALTKSGKMIVIDDSDSFVMPNEDVTVFVDAIKKVYTINFYVDDELVYRITGNKGDLIDLPLKARKDNDDKYMYIFDGWDCDENVITGNKDYHAKFSQIPLEFDLPENTGGKNYSLIIGIVVLASSFVLIGVGAFLVFKFFIKRK